MFKKRRSTIKQVLIYGLTFIFLVSPLSFSFAQDASPPSPEEGGESVQQIITSDYDLQDFSTWKKVKTEGSEGPDKIINTILIEEEDGTTPIDLVFHYYNDDIFYPGASIQNARMYYLQNIGIAGNQATYVILTNPNATEVVALFAGSTAAQLYHKVTKGVELSGITFYTIPENYENRKNGNTAIAKWGRAMAERLGYNGNNNIPIEMAERVPSSIDENKCEEIPMDQMREELQAILDKISSSEGFEKAGYEFELSKDITGRKLQELRNQFYIEPWESGDDLSGIDAIYRSFINQYQKNQEDYIWYWSKGDYADIAVDQLRNCAYVTAASYIAPISTPAVGGACAGGIILTHSTLLGETKDTELRAVTEINAALYFLGKYVERMDCLADQIKDKENKTEEEKEFLETLEKIKGKYKDLWGISKDLEGDFEEKAEEDFWGKIIGNLEEWINSILEQIFKVIIGLLNDAPI